jgi:hypothetical protein
MEFYELKYPKKKSLQKCFTSKISLFNFTNISPFRSTLRPFLYVLAKISVKELYCLILLLHSTRSFSPFIQVLTKTIDLMCVYAFNSCSVVSKITRRFGTLSLEAFKKKF